MNLGEIKTKVIQKLRERDTPRHWTEPEITENINQACKKFAAAIRAGERLTRLNLIDISQGLFSFPDRIMRKSSVLWNNIEITQVTAEYLDGLYRGSGDITTIGLVPESTMNWRTKTAESPLHWLIDEGYVRLFPKPLSLSSESTNIRESQSGTLPAGTVEINLSEDLPESIVGNKNMVDVFLNGVYQHKDQWNITAADRITMVGSTPVDVAFQVVHWGSFSVSEVRTLKFRMILPAGTKQIITPVEYEINKGAIVVSQDGITQAPSTYTELTDRKIVLDSELTYPAEIELIIYSRQSTIGLGMMCARMPVEMINDSDNPDLPSHLEYFHDAIWQWALVECFTREGQEKDVQSATFYAGQFHETIAEYNMVFDPPVQVPDIDAWTV